MAHWGVALPFRSGGETPYHRLDRLRTSVWWGHIRLQNIRHKETRVRDAPGGQPGGELCRSTGEVRRTLLPLTPEGNDVIGFRHQVERVVRTSSLG